MVHTRKRKRYLSFIHKQISKKNFDRYYKTIRHITYNEEEEYQTIEDEVLTVNKILSLYDTYPSKLINNKFFLLKYNKIFNEFVDINDNSFKLECEIDGNNNLINEFNTNTCECLNLYVIVTNMKIHRNEDKLHITIIPETIYEYIDINNN